MPTQFESLLVEAEKIAKKSPFIPVSDTLIVYVMRISETQGGIILPDQTGISQRGFAASGVVIAVGPGKVGELSGVLIPMPCERGDYIIFSSMAGLELGEIVRKEMSGLKNVSFEQIKLLRSGDVIAKVNKSNERN